jgi:cell division protein FtsX
LVRARHVFSLLLFALVIGGCGSAARQAGPDECVVRIYFCTKELCDTAATREQIGRVQRRLREREDVYSVRFVSKDAALAQMRKLHPAMVEQLPMNPFPDLLRVRPVAGASSDEIAAIVQADRDGVQAVEYGKPGPGFAPGSKCSG